METTWTIPFVFLFFFIKEHYANGIFIYIFCDNITD